MLPGRAAGVGKLARTERNLPGRPGSLQYRPCHATLSLLDREPWDVGLTGLYGEDWFSTIGGLIVIIPPFSHLDSRTPSGSSLISGNPTDY